MASSASPTRQDDIQTLELFQTGCHNLFTRTYWGGLASGKMWIPLTKAVEFRTIPEDRTARQEYRSNLEDIDFDAVFPQIRKFITTDRCNIKDVMSALRRQIGIDKDLESSIESFITHIETPAHLYRSTDGSVFGCNLKHLGLGDIFIWSDPKNVLSHEQMESVGEGFDDRLISDIQVAKYLLNERYIHSSDGRHPKSEDDSRQTLRSSASEGWNMLVCDILIRKTMRIVSELHDAISESGLVGDCPSKCWSPRTSGLELTKDHLPTSTT